MPDEDAELVRRFFAALARQELAPEIWAPDLIVDNTPDFPITGPYEGHAGLQEWWDDLAEVLDGARVELDEVQPLSAGRVLTTQRLVGTFSATGIPVDAPWVAIFQVRDGLLRRVSGFTSREQALAAAGLSPDQSASKSARKQQQS